MFFESGERRSAMRSPRSRAKRAVPGNSLPEICDGRADALAALVPLHACTQKIKERKFERTCRVEPRAMHADLLANFLRCRIMRFQAFQIFAPHCDGIDVKVALRFEVREERRSSESKI